MGGSGGYAHLDGLNVSQVVLVRLRLERYQSIRLFTAAWEAESRLTRTRSVHGHLPGPGRTSRAGDDASCPAKHNKPGIVGDFFHDRGPSHALSRALAGDPGCEPRRMTAARRPSNALAYRQPSLCDGYFGISTRLRSMVTAPRKP
jgi:hypothetical protein